MARTRCSSTSLAGWCGDETRTGVHDRRSDHRDHGAHRRAAGPDQQLGSGDADDRAGAALRGRGQRRRPHPRQHGDLHLMSALTRRGFTMVELLIALVILGIVSAALYKVLVTNQRTYLAQTQRIDLQQNIRAAATILPAELREINAAGTAGANIGDLSGMLSTSLTIRAPRQLGFLCVTPPLGGGIGQITLTVRKQPMFGARQTYARGDSVLVFYEGDPGTRNDDSWLRGEIKDVGNGNCPDANGTPAAWVLTLGAQWIAGSQFNAAGAITNGSPVRGFTSTTYSLSLSPTDNQYYLAQTATGSTQPMVGPLSGPNGLTFNYYDANGIVTTDSSKVTQIEIRVRGRTQSPISQPGAAGVAYKIDSVVTRVAIRGNTRCNPCL